LICGDRIPSAAAFCATSTGNACDGSEPVTRSKTRPEKQHVTFPAAESARLVSTFDAVSERTRGVTHRSYFAPDWQATVAASGKNPENLHAHCTASYTGITKRRSDSRVFEGRFVHVEQGDFVAIVGPSGSGKTHCSVLLAGLDTPTHGKVILDGHDLTTDVGERARKLRGEKVGFVFRLFS
jgi:ABC-type glutathione transport system ATPase component